MGDLRRSRTVFVVLTLASLTIMTIDLGEPAALDTARRAALAAFAPVQVAAAATVRPVTGAVDAVSAMRTRPAVVRQLRAQVERLRAVEVERDDLADENARLRQLLGLGQRMPSSTVGARVLGSPPGDDGRTMLIDAGAEQGLRPGMVVVDAGGLVGRLIAVTDHHARVEPVWSPEARYAVRVTSGGHAGRLRGGGDRRLRLELDDPGVSVPPGTAVVTRAFEGSAVPDGLPVGIVADDVGASRHRLVAPSINPAAVDVVLVVTDAASHPRAADLDRAPADGPMPPPPPVGERP